METKIQKLDRIEDLELLVKNDEVSVNYKGKKDVKMLFDGVDNSGIMNSHVKVVEYPLFWFLMRKGNSIYSIGVEKCEIGLENNSLLIKMPLREWEISKDGKNYQSYNRLLTEAGI